MANQNQDNDDNKVKSPRPSNKQSEGRIVGRRLKNPLGIFSSYNYQLSLYMLSTEALDIFIANGGNSLDGIPVSSIPFDVNAPTVDRPGAFIIAQSGGVNSSGGELRAPGFGFDYYIDDLEFESVMPKASGSSTVQHTFKFTITEPYGFSFITNLRRASEAVAGSSKKEEGSPENPTKMFFLLGIRFYGYDAEGNPITGKTKMPITDKNGQIIEGQFEDIDPGNTSEELFVRYFPIIITKVNNKIEGKETVYRIEAQSYFLDAIGTKRGLINNENIEIEGSTVNEMLQNLMDKLNRNEQKLSANRRPFKYNFEIAAPDKQRLGEAKIIVPGDNEKYKWQGSGAQTTDESNAALEVTNSTASNGKRKLTFNKAVPIVQVIDQIIAQSTFLSDAMKVIYDTSLEPDTKTNSLPNETSDNNKRIAWYNCSPDISSPEWDSKGNNDWVYDITYRLSIYETPFVDSTYTNPGEKFYGPYKIYDYWYTGQNTEILKYTQEIDNNYYLTYLGDNIFSKPGEGGERGISSTTGGAALAQGQSSGQPTQGKQGLSMEAQNTYITSLYDPKSSATAKIEIIGDPDLLSNTTPRRNTETTVYNKFYGIDGYSVDFTGGQAVILIRFNEAIDYDNNRNITLDTGQITSSPGTLSLNSSILFWRDPKEINQNFAEGIFYFILSCKSSFSKGVFRQTLECVIKLPDLSEESSEVGDGDREVSSGPGVDDLFKGDWVKKVTGEQRTPNRGWGDKNPRRKGWGDENPPVKGIADQSNSRRLNTGIADQPGYIGRQGIADRRTSTGNTET